MSRVGPSVLDKVNAFLDDPRLNEGIAKAGNAKELLVFALMFGLSVWLGKRESLAPAEKTEEGAESGL